MLKKPREIKIPLYYQLETSLRDRISSGELIEGDPFPTEQTLSEQYGVSRMTVRQALRSMTEDGLITRHPGRGTFVAHKELEKATQKSVGALEDAILMGFGYTYDTKVDQFVTVRSNKSIAEKLKIEKGAEVLKIERIRFFESEPIAFISNFIPIDIGQKLTIEDVQLRPVLKTLEESLGIDLDKADQTIEATIADTIIAKHLHVRVGSAILQMTRVTYDKNDRPVNYALVLFRADKYAFQVKLKRQSGSTPDNWICA